MKSGIPMEYLDKYTVDEIIDKARINIFNFSYPIYEASHKSTLEKKILKHYYTREISAETFGLWQLWLNTKMNEIMPKYNKLYRAEKELVDKMMLNIDVVTNHLRTDDLLHEADYATTSNTNDESTDKRRYSDTPQGSISFADADTGNVWLTEFERNDHEGESTNRGTNIGSDSNTGTQANDTTEKGYRGGRAYFELLDEFKDKVVNIDLMVINDLNDLFFGLW